MVEPKKERSPPLLSARKRNSSRLFRAAGGKINSSPAEDGLPGGFREPTARFGRVGRQNRHLLGSDDVKNRRRRIE